MKDGVNAPGRWNGQLICHRGYLADDLEGLREARRELPRRAPGQGQVLEVQSDELAHLELEVASASIRMVLLALLRGHRDSQWHTEVEQQDPGKRLWQLEQP